MSRSSVVGLFAGGAHLTGEVTKAPRQLEPVVDVDALGLVCEPRPVHRSVQPVAAAVTGEHSSGSVGAVGRRGETDDHQLGLGIAEARDASTPVVPVGVGRSLLDRDLFSPVDQPRARSTLRDLLGHDGERISPLVRTLCFRSICCHAKTVGTVHPNGTRNHVPRAKKRTKPTGTKPTTVLLVRHGRTPTTGQVLPGRAKGLHLGDEGIAQAQRAADRIAALGKGKIAAVYSSPMERARETAAPIGKATGNRVQVRKGLVEADFGEWTGKKLVDLNKLPEWSQVQRYPERLPIPRR